MTAPIRLRLDQVTRTAVSERYEHTRGAVERTNYQIVLLADEGRNAPEVAWLVRRGPHQVRKCCIGFSPRAWLAWLRAKRRAARWRLCPAGWRSCNG
jgi:hypothetical protein